MTSDRSVGPFQYGAMSNRAHAEVKLDESVDIICMAQRQKSDARLGRVVVLKEWTEQ